MAGHEGNYEDAEDVEAAIDRGNRAADREHEGALQVKKTHEGFNGDHDRSHRKSITRRPQKTSARAKPRLRADHHRLDRSVEHTSELHSLMHISSSYFSLNKNNKYQ